MPPGRPQIKLEINFQNPLQSLNDIENICKNKIMRANVVTFARALLSLAGENQTKSCQTDFDSKSLMNEVFEKNTAENTIESICDKSQKMVNYERSFLITKLLKQINEKDKVKLLFMFYCDLSKDGQSDIFSFLGNSLN